MANLDTLIKMSVNVNSNRYALPKDDTFGGIVHSRSSWAPYRKFLIMIRILTHPWIGTINRCPVALGS
jgi:hypothetical protein